MGNKGKWTSKTLKMKKGHIWQAKPGNQICMLGYGDVSFEIPLRWVVVPDNDSVKLYDKKPPKDDVRFAVSNYKLNPYVNWNGLQLADLVKIAVESDARKLTPVTDYIHSQQRNIVICWQECTFVDVEGKRPAFTRWCLLRYFDLFCMLTVDFWPEDRELVETTWEIIMNSFTMGLKIKDIRLGY